VIIDGHRETWPIRSKPFRYAYMRHLRRQLDQLLTAGSTLASLMKSGMSKTAINAAIDDFEARAIRSPTAREVCVCVAGHDGNIHIDLGTATWEAVRITAAGWSIIESPPVRFRRTSAMLPLPMPARGGKIEALRPFLNTTVSDFTCVGTMEDLLDLVGPSVGVRSTKRLSDDLRRLAPMLRSVGVEIIHEQSTNQQRTLRIERIARENGTSDEG
jgi:hypothetical protein